MGMSTVKEMATLAKERYKMRKDSAFKKRSEMNNKPERRRTKTKLKRKRKRNEKRR